MPLYEYQCRKCESKFEVLERSTETEVDPACPGCDSRDTSKVFSSFASVGGGNAGPCDTGST